MVEVSWGVGPYDVERAVERARLLSKLGTPALPVVAGKVMTKQAASLAEAKHVQHLIEGRRALTTGSELPRGNPRIVLIPNDLFLYPW